MNELMKDTSHRTPIEIALGIDEKGMTTAKKLYEFLELNAGNYAILQTIPLQKKEKIITLHL